jgi:hypothetical protein
MREGPSKWEGSWVHVFSPTRERLNAKAYRPSSWQLQENGRNFPPNYLHQSWRDYLYWEFELEA